MRHIELLKKVNFIQFVPAIFVISLVGNSIFGYTAPKVKKSNPNAQTKQVEAATTTAKKKAKKAKVGDIDLSKIKDGTYHGEANGYRGKVKVAVTVKSHKITAIKVLSSSDDAAFFNRASAGVIKSILAKQSLKVDVVSGATYSSNGIIKAVKNALTGETDKSSVKAAANSGSKGSAASAGKVKESGTYKDGTFTGSASGYHGTVKVEVTIKNGKITAIKVLESHDDAAYFNRAKGTLLPLMIKKQTTNVDAVSGATYSSNGIIKAVRNALSKAAVDGSVVGNDSDSASDSSSNHNNNNSNQHKNNIPNVSGTYKDGVYEGTGKGFRGNITVKVTIKYSKIVAISLVKNEKDDKQFFEKAWAEVPYSIIALQSANENKVDAVSGATYSSHGIMAAVRNALTKALSKKDDHKKNNNDNNKNDNSNNNNNNNKNDNNNNNNNNKNDNNNNNNQPDSDGTVYTAKAVCVPDEELDFRRYNLTINVPVSTDGVIDFDKITASGDGASYNNEYIQFARNGIIKQLKSGMKIEDCDVVSGATCSSKAIKEAYQDVVQQMEK